MRLIRTIVLSSVAALIGAVSAHAEPLKFALVETLSGPQALTGQLNLTVLKREIDKFNAAGGFRGEKVELLEYDNQGTTVGAADRLRAAIAGGARVIAQGASTAIAVQISEDVRKYNLRNPGKEVVFLNLGAEGMELTGEKCHFYHIRIGSNTAMRFNVAVKALSETGNLGRRVFLINQNYSPGFTVQKTIEDNASKFGYEIVGKILHEVNKVQDFSPYVAQIQQVNPDTVITGNWSNDLVLLMKAAADANLKAHFVTAYLDQPGNLASAGAVANGHYLVNTFNPQYSDAASALAEEYKAAVGHYPTYAEPQTIFGMQLFLAALKSLNDKQGSVSTNDIVVAMENTRITTPMGEQYIRKEDHQTQLSLILSRVSPDARFKVDGTQYGFVPVKKVSADQIGDLVQDGCKMGRPE